MSKLTKPHFIKVKDLVRSRSGYNVYVKVVSAEESKSNDGRTTFVRAVVADETASVNTFFKGQTAKLIKQGATIAIRNGKIRYIKNKLSLEIDIFGRVTPENIQIKANDKGENISDKEVQFKTERRPRYDKDRPRRRRQEDEDRPPRRRRQEDEDRPRRRPRQDDRDFERRDNRRDRGDRDRGDRQDRRPRRDFDDRERKPRRDYDDRERRGERRPPINWTKIGAIEPGDEDLNILAKVVSMQNVGKKVRVVLGDETAIVKGFIFNDEWIKEGSTIVLFKASAVVQKEHIEIQLPRGGKTQKARREIHEVSKKYDVSAKEWVEAS